MTRFRLYRISRLSLSMLCLALVFSACEDAGDPVFESSGVVLREAQTGNGMCAGPCLKTLHFSAKLVQMSVGDYDQPWYTRIGYLTTAGEAAFLAAEKSLSGVNLAGLGTSKSCADGIATILVESGSATIELSYDAACNLPSQLAKVQKVVNEMVDALSECKSTDLITISGPCGGEELSLEIKESYKVGEQLVATISNKFKIPMFWPSCSGPYTLERYDDASKSWQKLPVTECDPSGELGAELPGGESVTGTPFTLLEPGSYQLQAQFLSRCWQDPVPPFEWAKCFSRPITLLRSFEVVP